MGKYEKMIEEIKLSFSEVLKRVMIKRGVLDPDTVINKTLEKMEQTKKFNNEIDSNVLFIESFIFVSNEVSSVLFPLEILEQALVEHIDKGFARRINEAIKKKK